MKLYSLLVFSLLLSRFFDHLWFLPFFILLLPLYFLESQRFGLKNVWNLTGLVILPLLLTMDYRYIASVFMLAFVEELFFRAYMMKYHTNLVVSLLFVIPHFIVYTDIHSLLVFFPSLLFGYIYEKSNSLVFVTVVHGIFNIIYDKLLPSLLPQLLKNLLNFSLG